MIHATQAKIKTNAAIDKGCEILKKKYLEILEQHIEQSAAAGKYCTAIEIPLQGDELKAIKDAFKSYGYVVNSDDNEANHYIVSWSHAATLEEEPKLYC